MILKTKLLAHRGYKSLYPENTMLAFNKAMDFADGFELDIQKTQDGKYVIIHDETVDRTSNGKGFVKDITLEELKNMDFGNGEKIISLEELFDKIHKDTYVNIELKVETITREDSGKIIEIIKGHNINNIMVSSFDSALLYDYRNAGITVGFLIDDSPFFEVMKNVHSLKPDYLNLPVEMFNRLPRIIVGILISYFKFSGRKIAFWTVNSYEEYALVKRYADIIISDDVSNLRDMIITTK